MVVPVGAERDGTLGRPATRTRPAGTPASWWALTGTVILDAHTYHDDSAILKTSFPQKAHVGMAIQLHCADGRSRSYAATEVTVDLTVHSYPPLVESGRLYASDRPPQLVLVTCTDWSAARRDWDKRAIIIATHNLTLPPGPDQQKWS